MQVITQSIITITVPTVHTTFATFSTIPVMVTWAKVTLGKTKTPSKTKKSIFLFTPLEVCLYVTKIVIFRQPYFLIIESRFASAERPLTGFVVVCPPPFRRGTKYKTYFLINLSAKKY